MAINVLTYKQMEGMLKADQNAYISVISVSAVRLDTFMSTDRLVMQLPMESIDAAKAAVATIAKDSLENPASVLPWGKALKFRRAKRKLLRHK